MSVKDTESRYDKDFKKKIRILEKKWENMRVHPYQRWGTRLLRSVDLIKNITREFDCSVLNLLDIGCYNGVLSIIASKYFKNVVGIDKHKSRMKSSILSSKIFGSGDNCKFKSIYLFDYIKDGYFDKHNINSVMALQVLYHLNTKEVNRLKEKLDAKVKLAILGTRPNKDYTNNKYDLRKVDHVLEHLVKPYFEKWDVYYKRTTWPIIVASK